MDAADWSSLIMAAAGAIAGLAALFPQAVRRTKVTLVGCCVALMVSAAAIASWAPGTAPDPEGPRNGSPPSSPVDSRPSSPVDAVSSGATASPDASHAVAFEPRSFTITDGNCGGSYGFDFDKGQVVPEFNSGAFIEFEYSSCPAGSRDPYISIQNAAAAMAMTNSAKPDYQECERALSSAPIDRFLPQVGDTFCIRSSARSPFGTAAGPIIGYAHVRKLTNGRNGTLYRGTITLEAGGWFVDS